MASRQWAINPTIRLARNKGRTASEGMPLTTKVS